MCRLDLELEIMHTERGLGNEVNTSSRMEKCSGRDSSVLVTIVSVPCLLPLSLTVALLG